MAGYYVGIRLFGQPGKLIDDKQFRRDLARTNQKFAKRAKRAFERSVATWTFPPVFHQETSPKGIRVFTEDSVYFWLDEGTSVRYMHMTEDFSPKTRPGTLYSTRGAGGPAYLDLSDPLEGIEPRRFADQVYDLIVENYERAVQEDIERATRTR